MTGKAGLCSVGFLWTVATVLHPEHVNCSSPFLIQEHLFSPVISVCWPPRLYFHIHMGRGSPLRSPKESFPYFSQSSRYDNKVMHIFKANSVCFLSKLDSLKLFQTQVFLAFETQKSLIFFFQILNPKRYYTFYKVRALMLKKCPLIKSTL